MNDITTTPGTAVAEVAQGMQLHSLFEMALAAARDPEIDAAKLAVVIGLATNQQDREAERRFRISKQRALLEMPSITKRGAITNRTGDVQSRYSKFEDIDRVVRPILARHSLTISFNVGNTDRGITVQPILSYADDEVAFEERGGEMFLPIDTTGSKNPTQGAGSAASYGKRHTLKAMLNIIEEAEDDDGAGADKIALPAEKQALVDLARQKATEGSVAYQQFFGALSKEDKGFLGYALAETGDTYHEQNKRASALYD